MTNFTREEINVRGVRTVVYSVGLGEPLVYFHGAGTVTGFDFIEAWADRFRVIAPFHPGFGESGDNPSFTDIHDYVMHYLDLFDLMKIDAIRLVGVSMGGYLAAKFASEHGHRIRKLVLVCPYGLDVPEHPALDLINTPGQQIPGLLVSNFETIKPYLPDHPGAEFIEVRQREAMTFARLFREHPTDPKFSRHLDRIRMPTLVVWGNEDKIIPPAHADVWKARIPQAEVRMVEGAGHIVYLDRPDTLNTIGRFWG